METQWKKRRETYINNIGWIKFGIRACDRYDVNNNNDQASNDYNG